jgi:hypothetical protein
MENKIISENVVKSVLDKILNEETSKVKRDEFNRVQFKIEELQNSLNETIKEFRKLQDSIPNGLKTISNGRVSGISNSLVNAQKLIVQLKEKIKQHKRTTYSQQVDEKKK